MAYYRPVYIYTFIYAIQFNSNSLLYHEIPQVNFPMYLKKDTPLLVKQYKITLGRR